MSEYVLCRICGGPLSVEEAEDTGGAHHECSDEEGGGDAHP